MSDAAPSPTTINQLHLLPGLRARVRRHVDETIRSLLPIHQKLAYIEATLKAPHLVETESDPLQFVRYCNYNLWSGAERLCLYWTERKALFGEKHAFLPLTLTGEGALTKEDVLSLHAGYPAFLPDTITGQKAILFDRRKWIPGATAENRLRCLFYVFRIMAEDDRAQIDGVLLLLMLATPRLKELQWPYIHRALHLGANVFPIKFHFHLLSIPHQKKQPMFQDIMVTSVQAVLHHFKTHCQWHVQTRPNQLFEAIRALGMPKEGIPQFLGGEWKFEEFFHWCQERAVLEHTMNEEKNSNIDENVNPPALAALDLDRKQAARKAAPQEQGRTEELDRKPAARKAPPQNDQPENRTTRKRPRPAAAQSPISEEERVANRRMADLLHSRRKRERKRQAVEALKAESAELVKEHHDLLAENARLEQLLSQARELGEQMS